MSNTNYKKIFAIKNKDKTKIKQIVPEIQDKSGIYILTRFENGFKYGYIGLATVSVWTRLAEHLSGYQHIDLSIKKHGWYSETNQSGWRISYFYAPAEQLNDLEQEYIKKYANAGYQLRNKTAGSQSKGKFGIADNRPAKGYHDGLKQGYLNARKEVAHWFELHLECTIKGKSTKNKEKALEKFIDFITLDKKEKEVEENE
jgi:hypothetical protein